MLLESGKLSFNIIQLRFEMDSWEIRENLFGDSPVKISGIDDPSISDGSTPPIFPHRGDSRCGPLLRPSGSFFKPVIALARMRDARDAHEYGSVPSGRVESGADLETC
jgi:hypothetical protein